MVVLVPVPVIDPGLIVQVPDGKPLNTTLPVDTVQVGCVIVPTVGAVGKRFTITVLSVLDVPHKPVEIAVIVAIPLNASSQFIIPVVAFINPAVTGNTEYVIEVLFSAVAI